MTKQDFIHEATIRIFAAGLNNPDVNMATAIQQAEQLAERMEAVAPFNDRISEAEQLGKAIMAQVLHSQPAFDQPDPEDMFVTASLPSRWATVKRALRSLFARLFQTPKKDINHE